jgi:hypothetical protein
MTTRRWMIVVAVVAVLTAWGLWGRRMAEVYRLKALTHAAHEANGRLSLRMLRTPTVRTGGAGFAGQRVQSRLLRGVVTRPGSKDLLADWEGPPIDVEPSGTARRAYDDDLQRKASPVSRKVAYHARMRRKYEWAAWLPWFPLLPDPPEPD